MTRRLLGGGGTSGGRIEGLPARMVDGGGKEASQWRWHEQLPDQGVTGNSGVDGCSKNASRWQWH
ncbi:hypothetical protein E2562_035326 [Oryza meyeriana var. granulata]|uniref:Uncharacterized protein n=1 Tax=Oryza meyeriana var. granulata TaxID=110450 RepID=A0A6G1DS42_9ORYZ|nr:hypothetical protein E2562_035326 [Oryza meyeriana var. granulata]